MQQAESAVRLAATVGGRPRIEDSDAVSHLIEGYVGMPENDQACRRE
jgi:hypothetical protein